MRLVIDRFDLRMDGTYRGIEDFCVLNGRKTDEKYRGSYETLVMKRFGKFADSTHVNEDKETRTAELNRLLIRHCEGG
jgi:serine/threonine-protein kinase HipA